MNAKTEFLLEIEGKPEILCALIEIEDSWMSEKKGKYVLPVGFSTCHLESFLQSININYDNGYGAQELSGCIWYLDGTWSHRMEYDGSEWWEYQKTPEIPGECKIESEKK